MHSYKETRVLPYTAKQIYDLVLDVEKYPEFLPWCSSLRIVDKDADNFTADMRVCYKVFSEVFRSRVTFSPDNSIEVDYIKGPFSNLKNHWIFKDINDSSCEVQFFVEFAFESSILQKAMQMLFGDAVKVMIKSFEDRAQDIYR